ncbi:MAG: DNA repair protein RadC [Cytophagales bacterium]|nr:DNA repair protein RadC [Cytophagales bacterium]
MHNQLKISYLKIQDLAEADRPREKLMHKGSNSLSEAELIGILIGSGTKNMSAVSLAQLILKHYNNDLSELAKRSVKELQKFKGIGEAKAIAIVSAMELGRRRKEKEYTLKPKLTDAKRVYDLMKAELTDKLVEEFWVILLNQANYLIKKQRISTGGLASTIADPRIIFKAAIEHNSSGIILVHNHPSGNSQPSRSDIQLTERLIRSGKVLRISVLDHIIFTEDDYFSFVDNKLI